MKLFSHISKISMLALASAAIIVGGCDASLDELSTEELSSYEVEQGLVFQVAESDETQQIADEAVIQTERSPSTDSDDRDDGETDERDWPGRIIDVATDDNFIEDGDTEEEEEASELDEVELTETVIEEEEEEIAIAAPPLAIYDEASEPVIWNPSGTSKIPVYGSHCRLTTDNVFETPTNGLTDDSIYFEIIQGIEATFDLVVNNGTNIVLDASVEMTRGLPGKSYRMAEGTAIWLDGDVEKEVAVVDGTLCFAQKLNTVSDEVLAEFSLIIESDGVFYAMGGNMLVPANVIGGMNASVINADQSLDIDLR